MAITKKKLKKIGYKNYKLQELGVLFGEDSKNSNFKEENRELLYKILNDKEILWTEIQDSNHIKDEESKMHKMVACKVFKFRTLSKNLTERLSSK